MAKILVIEDNPANMKLATLLLHHVGHVVLCAVDAETGLTMARSEKPDLILMDIQLPGMDGLAATELLKRDAATANIPVIALTAMAMKEDQEKTRVAGCDAYIAKPLRYQELYAAINKLLSSETSTAVKSEKNFPTVVTPLSNAEPAATLPTYDEILHKGRLILVAEDNEMNQKLILRQLALLGFAANVAANGKLALERWQTGKYALLITDLQMPEMDGYQLTAAIRQSEQGTRRAPIIALTANVFKGEADRCRLLGMDDYLGKPLQLADLKTRLEKWLPAVDTGLPYTHEIQVRKTDSKVLDLSVLQNAIGSDPVVIAEFLRDFQNTALKISLELTRACEHHEALLAGQQAHKLMSSARAIGATALGALCAEIETIGKAGNLEMLTALLPLFEQEFDKVYAYIDALLAKGVDCLAEG